MEDFFNVPLVLKDYKDLIPEDYNDREYYEGKPVEGVIFLKQFYRDNWNGNVTFEILCYRIPHVGNRDTMCYLKTFEPIKLQGRSIPKEKINEAVTKFYNTYIKDNIAGIHKGELEAKLKYLSSELTKTQNAINNLIEFNEKYGKENKLKWTDLKIGDIIRKTHEDGYCYAMVVKINTYSTEKHVGLAGELLTDQELENWEKMENKAGKEINYSKCAESCRRS